MDTVLSFIHKNINVDYDDISDEKAQLICMMSEMCDKDVIYILKNLDKLTESESKFLKPVTNIFLGLLYSPVIKQYIMCNFMFENDVNDRELIMDVYDHNDEIVKTVTLWYNIEKPIIQTHIYVKDLVDIVFDYLKNPLEFPDTVDFD